MGKTNNRKILRIAVVLVIAASILAIGCGMYLSDYYHADMKSVEAFSAVDEVESYMDDSCNYIFEPQNADTGFIFYPGGKVEYTSYIPLMESLASEGILCVLIEMPFNLAVFDINAADGIIDQYPQIGEWYIGGHSLGGSMAASYLEKHVEDFDGLVLLGSYSTADLSESGLKVLSVYGSEDNVIDMEKYNENKVNLPENFTEFIIDGGCHAYFGMYGYQEGDGKPEITNEEQIEITVDEIKKKLR